MQLCFADRRKLWVFELTLATAGNTGAATVLQFERWIPDDKLEVVCVGKLRKSTMKTLLCHVKKELAFCMTFSQSVAQEVFFFFPPLDFRSSLSVNANVSNFVTKLKKDAETQLASIKAL